MHHAVLLKVREELLDGLNLIRSAPCAVFRGDEGILSAWTRRSFLQVGEWRSDGKERKRRQKRDTLRRPEQTRQDQNGQTRPEKIRQDLTRETRRDETYIRKESQDRPNQTRLVTRLQ